MSDSTRPVFTYFGHSTVRVDFPDGQRWLIDPWVAGNPSCPSELHDLGHLDAMLITHSHADHFADAVDVAQRYRPEKVVANFEICCWLEAKGVENTAPMNLGGSQNVLGHSVTMVRADHSSSIDDNGMLLDGGTASGYVIRTADDFTFYHAGDTALFGDLKLFAELYRPRLGFLPIGDLFTMGPADAARACRYLGLRRVIPIHWGTFPVLTGTPADFERAVKERELACETIVLEPGDTY